MAKVTKVIKKPTTTKLEKALGDEMAKDLSELKAPKKPRGRKSFNWTSEKGTEVKQHRAGTKRATVVELLTSKKGATFVQVQEEIAKRFPGGEWNDATCYEGIKLIHSSLGYTLTQDDKGVIRATVPA